MNMGKKTGRREVREVRDSVGIGQRFLAIPYLGRRLMAVAAGNVVMAFSVCLLRLSLFGTDPFSCMNLGYSILSGFSFGICIILCNCVLIVAVLFLDRSYIHIGTLVNMFLLGLMGDAFYALIAPLAGNPAEIGLLVRGILLLVAIPVCCFGCSAYVSANLGMGPYDAIGWIAEQRSRGRVKFRYFRIGLDSTAVAIGFAAGSIVGPGTVIMAFFTGPLISYFNDKVNMPLIYGKRREE